MNTEVNTADNAAENTEVNTEVNTAENTGDNTADNTAVAEIDLTPKRAVQGVDDVLVQGTGYTPGGTAEAYLKPVDGPVLAAVAPPEGEFTPFAAIAVPGENIGTVEVDENGELSFRVNSSELDLGDYTVTVIDNEDPALGDSENFTVVADDGNADNTADNTADNVTDNTAENTEANTEANTADNVTDNTAVNTADNVADNAAENTEANTEVNTADNTAENTSDNTADNAAENTSDNTADNAAEAPAIAADPSSVEDGETTTVTGEDFPPNTEVEVQLVDPDGNPVGDSVTVTTDEDGAFTTDLTVPEDAVAGDYTVEAAAETGESAAADLAVTNGSDDNTGDDATTDPGVAVDPGTVDPGESTTVTGEDFPPNTEVEVQLVDPDGNPVGDSVTVTTDEDGAFTTDLTVPEDAVAGDYTVEAAAETGESAAADLTVAAPAGDDNTADNTGTNTGDNTGDDTSTGGNGSSGNGSSGSSSGDRTPSSGSSSLAQTGAAGTAAMVGLAALLLIGGAAGVLISRRSAG